MYKPERCIRTTFEAAKTYGFPTRNIMFEFTETEEITDSSHLKAIVEYYQSIGFRTATDDFGAERAGLGLLANFQSDIIKLDMGLIRAIDQDVTRQFTVKSCLNFCRDLGITPSAEGVETAAGIQWLPEAGISLMQGYLFAKPSFECLPDVDFNAVIFAE